jgi:hypothetical protein
MIVAYAFIGKLPSYSIETVHQTRLFFDGPIYFIVSDMQSEYVDTLQNKYNVTIINYSDVIDNTFIELVCTSVLRTADVPNLGDRSALFIRSFERFYVLHNLMIKNNLENVFFMELDNLIYDDPTKWLTSFCQKDICYMYDNNQRCSSGISFIKSAKSLKILIDFFTKHIKNFVVERDGQINEMTALALFHETNKEIVQILPIHWSPTEYPVEYSESFGLYNSIFDSAALGIYFFGIDTYHTEGKIVKYKKWWGSLIDYTIYNYQWKFDDNGRNIPYIWNGTIWIRINNLHIHSKLLTPALSITLS